MGVLNLTPDSFSDGGQFLDPDLALDRAWQMVEQGADIIDLGAESSRPGAEYVSEEEEWTRLEPVLNRLKKGGFDCPISVDTNKPNIMTRLHDYGVELVNDIKGGADDETLAVLAKQSMIYIAMHMHKDPKQMQTAPLKGDEAIGEIDSFYDSVSGRLRRAGFADDSIWFDPGIGFGKDDAANLKLIKHSLQHGSQHHLLLGISRKSFMGRLLGLDDPIDRDPPSKMLETCFLMMGIKCIRTHDVEKLSHIKRLLS
ncbi:dihydropteroate synthase [Pseudobacteriovorax antillogorgiicola]|uniref:dihydropteroate synthase n=1 Tax=Pseudobacteriovorax antillogorgiicola TaxID=1513793 RepID=A0A1Y6CR96_9BACT|nr:dihydropteroate synthase [Pseudobacteriovorax antillogorgiicola]TCS46162.1 dihydropteroate synthase [Pseudobacteriovorax antillogorgiicola]SMF69892.1 dihydropteroate synthase [Pseudobacteriovorax antillogorgiicola]